MSLVLWIRFTSSYTSFTSSLSSSSACCRESLWHFKVSFPEIAVLIILIRIPRYYLKHASFHVSFIRARGEFSLKLSPNYRRNRLQFRSRIESSIYQLGACAISRSRVRNARSKVYGRKFSRLTPQLFYAHSLCVRSFLFASFNRSSRKCLSKWHTSCSIKFSRCPINHFYTRYAAGLICIFKRTTTAVRLPCL